MNTIKENLFYLKYLPFNNCLCSLLLILEHNSWLKLTILCSMFIGYVVKCQNRNSGEVRH